MIAKSQFNSRKVLSLPYKRMLLGFSLNLVGT